MLISTRWFRKVRGGQARAVLVPRRIFGSKFSVYEIVRYAVKITGANHLCTRCLVNLDTYNPLKHFYCSSLKCNTCNNFVCSSCVHQSNNITARKLQKNRKMNKKCVNFTENYLSDGFVFGTPTAHNPAGERSDTTPITATPGSTSQKPLSPSQTQSLVCKTCHDKAEIERIKFNIFSVPVQIRTSRSMFATKPSNPKIMKNANNILAKKAGKTKQPDVTEIKKTSLVINLQFFIHL